VADKLRAGVIWANTFNRFDPASPFGGYKESGYGREGGRHGLAAYLAPAPAVEVAEQPAKRRSAGRVEVAEEPAKRASRSRRPAKKGESK
jgi:acyl-CoA reductase-like NAD-dependent aldehyde dehydrogenase